jgi:hypothetical protein
MYKSADVTLQRGLIGALDLLQRVSRLRNDNMLAHARVMIQLKGEENEAVIAT